jgi:hypothetical protein
MISEESRKPYARVVSGWTPMGGRALIDAGVVICLVRRRPGSCRWHRRQRLQCFCAYPLFQNCVMARWPSARVERSFAQLEGFSKELEVLTWNPATAAYCSPVKAWPAKEGQPHPGERCVRRNHRLSRDAHFHEIEGLDVGLPVIFAFDRLATNPPPPIAKWAPLPL